MKEMQEKSHKSTITSGYTLLNTKLYHTLIEHIFITLDFVAEQNMWSKKRHDLDFAELKILIINLMSK